ncbi:GntR family transcriptional regulator [Bosea thiooxidans]|nr:GntR family transcriptional regulator [Bosea sp. (in: a-proteobacteria)]
MPLTSDQQPIERLSLADVAMRRLRDEIVRGRLLPGEVLTEIALAARLGVGRGTVRTALFALEADELIVRAPYSNWRVASLDDQVIWEIYTLREAMEGLAARILAGRADRCSRSVLADAFAQLGPAEAGSVDERVAADLGFHRAIVETTGHRHLIKRYGALSTKMEWLYRWSETHWPARFPLVDDHRALFEGVMDGTPDKAERAVRAHIEPSLAADLEGYRVLVAAGGAASETAFTKSGR